MSSNTINQDWSWSDRFIPAISAIVGPHLLVSAPIAIDRHEATDLLVLSARNLRIACRVRRSGFNAAYADEFTLRSRRQSGTSTEFEKIVNGWGDWLFYGFASKDEVTLQTWHLIDLMAFRAHLIRNQSSLRTGERVNADGSAFRFFDLKSFPDSPPLLVASSRFNQVIQTKGKKPNGTNRNS